MRHRVRGRKLGRTTAHRTALFRNQLTALFTHERIITTLAKAKELRPMAERMVTLAGTGSLPARRKVLTMVPDKVIVRRLFDEIAPRFVDRPGGYTRIMRLGRRHGDGAEMAIIEFVDYDLAEHEEGSGPGKSKTSLMDRAKGMFGGGAKAAADEAEAAETETAEEGATAADAEPSAEPVDEPDVVEAAPAAEPVDEPEALEVTPADEPADEPEAAEATPVAEPVDEPEAVEAKPAAAPVDEPESADSAPAEATEAEPLAQPEADAGDDEKKDS
jgi:large subunit ribosomal protein L17